YPVATAGSIYVHGAVMSSDTPTTPVAKSNVDPTVSMGRRGLSGVDPGRLSNPNVNTAAAAFVMVLTPRTSGSNASVAPNSGPTNFTSYKPGSRSRLRLTNCRVVPANRSLLSGVSVNEAFPLLLCTVSP